MSRLLLILIPILIAIVPTSATTAFEMSPTPTVPPATNSTLPGYCVGFSNSDRDAECFEVFADAILVATDGAINLPRTFRSVDYTPEFQDAWISSHSLPLDPYNGYVVAKFYPEINWCCAEFLQKGYACVSETMNYGSFQGIGNYWMNNVESAETGYVGCHSTVIYDFVYEVEPWVTCHLYCASLGNMSNRGDVMKTYGPV